MIVTQLAATLTRLGYTVEQEAADESLQIKLPLRCSVRVSVDSNGMHVKPDLSIWIEFVPTLLLILLWEPEKELRSKFLLAAAVLSLALGVYRYILIQHTATAVRMAYLSELSRDDAQVAGTGE